MSVCLERFDRDFTLAELLRGLPLAKLEAALAGPLGENWAIEEADGTPVMGPGMKPGSAVIDAPLRIDIETSGRLLASESARTQVEACAAWLEMVLAGAYRYRMASDVHLEAVHADYEELQRKHAELQASEARYRDLAAQLEQRVKVQVAQIERTQRQLYQVEKMASVGSLAAGMAHEINNPIGFIRSNLASASAYFDKMRRALEVLRRGHEGPVDPVWQGFDLDFTLEDFPVLLAESITGADRIARIVASLKTYASVDCPRSAKTDLNDAVRAAAAVLADQWPDKVSLEMDLAPLPKIDCDQSRMNQVLFSLIQNAYHALGKQGGAIRIASRAADGEIRLDVRDNGSGIAPNILPRIFDPFFTTREIGKGMGLGLTVSRDILAAHGGHIEVETEVGAGSMFSIRLPIARGAA
jgi:C4-dicarboxylate-specific signal transduction histidine kinase